MNKLCFGPFMPCYFCFLSTDFCVSLFTTVGWFLYACGGFVTLLVLCFFLMFVMVDVLSISPWYSVFIYFHLTLTWELCQLCFCYFLNEDVSVNLPPVNCYHDLVVLAPTSLWQWSTPGGSSSGAMLTRRCGSRYILGPTAGTRTRPSVWLSEMLNWALWGLSVLVGDLGDRLFPWTL